MIETKRTPEYEAFHQKVVGACVKIMGEEHREFFDMECDYLDEFAEGLDPDEVAQAQYDALT
jgi:hypothetical protein